MNDRAKRTLTVTTTAVALAVAGGIAYAANDDTGDEPTTREQTTTAAADEPDTDPTTAAATEESGEPVDERQQWADDVIQLWMDSTPVGDHPTEVFRDIESWDSPAEGELVIYTDPAITRGSDNCQADLPAPHTNLEWVTIIAMQNVVYDVLDLESVTAETTDGECSTTYTREDYFGPHSSGNNDPTTQAWADEMISIWLEANGLDSIDDFGPTFSKIQSWEATGEGELTIYTDPSIMNIPQNSDMGPHYSIVQMVWDRLYCGAPELESVTAVTTTVQHVETWTRDDDRVGSTRAGGCDPALN